MIVFFIILRNQQTLLTFLHEKCLFFMHVWILAHLYTVSIVFLFTIRHKKGTRFYGCLETVRFLLI